MGSWMIKTIAMYYINYIVIYGSLMIVHSYHYGSFPHSHPFPTFSTSKNVASGSLWLTRELNPPGDARNTMKHGTRKTGE